MPVLESTLLDRALAALGVIISFAMLSLFRILSGQGKRMNDHDIALALCDRQSETYEKQRLEDNERREKQREEMMTRIDKQHEIVMKKLESVETRIRNGG